MSDDEASNVFDRLKRYAGVTTGVAGVALRGAGRWLGGRNPLDVANAADLARVLGSLRGPLMKVGQVAGSLPDVLPADFAAELAKLQANAPEMGVAMVRRRMAAELGRDWQAKFKSFDLAAAQAASLGQVHRAVAHDGRVLACKLQYPDMQSAVDADLSQLKTILTIQRAAEANFDTREVAAEVEERLREELDYKREAQSMRAFGKIFERDAAIAVPAPVAELSTGRLLTMTWLEGQPFRDAFSRSQTERNVIAETLFRAWFAPLYRYGVVHGDAHFGNYTLRGDGGINLLDFGCVRIFQPKIIEALIDLHRATATGDDTLAAQAYAKWGFDGAGPDVVSKMRAWVKLAFAATLDDRERPIGDPAALSGGMKQVFDMKMQLREGDPVRPPREFVFISRALIGIGAALVQLDARLNWHRLYEALIADFRPQSLAERQAALFAKP